MPRISHSSSNYIRQTNNSVSKEQKVSDISKSTSIAVQRNPLKNTNFTANTSHRGATVFEIVDKSAGRLKNGTPVGAPAFRVDSPHGKVNYNHINTNTEIYKDNKIIKALDHKKISNTTYNISKNFDDVAKIAKTGGKAVAVAAVIIDGKDIYDSYKSDGNAIGKNTVKTTAGVAGSWAGGVAGAKIGGTGGAAIGTMICPGIGTAIGGFVGALAGGITGSFAGRSASESIVEKVYK